MISSYALGTVMFLVAAIVGSVISHFSTSKELRSLALLMVITSAVCCWMLWSIIYIGQLKPLQIPILKAVKEAVPKKG